MSRLIYARYVRNRKYRRVRHGRVLLDWLAAQAARLTGTGASLTFVVDNAVRATGVLTLTGNLVGEDFATGVLTFGANAGNDETVTIGSQVYTFQTSLVDSPNNVLIGASASDSLDNLIAAINGDAGAGTLYGTGTPVNSDVSAAAGAGDTMDVTAKTVGAGPNSVDTLTDVTSASWGAAVLEGGLDGDTVTIGDQVYLCQATLVDAPNNILEGATASDTIDNLIAAINGAAGAGTTYGTGTPVNAYVTAAAGAGDTMDVTSVLPGDLGNGVATLESSGNASWGAGVLENGLFDPDVTATSHGLSSGDGPYEVTSSGALPDGLSATIPVYVINGGVNTLNFAFTEDQAEAGVSIPLGNAGTGTLTLTKGEGAAAMFSALQEGNKPRFIEAATDADNL